MLSAPRRLAFYFDYLSPYSYLAWNDLRQRLGKLSEVSKQEVTLSPRPVLLAALLDAGGQLGPAEVPAKRRFVARDVLRRARRLGVSLVWPERHPFRPLDALRLSLPEVAGEQQLQVIDTLWKAGWREGMNLGDREQLEQALGAAGLPVDTLLLRASSDEAKRALRKETEAAIARGVFGVPTVMLDHELIWGADRLDDVFGLIAGDPMLEIDEQAYEETIAKPLGVRRKRLTDASGVPPVKRPKQAPFVDDGANDADGVVADGDEAATDDGDIAADEFAGAKTEINAPSVPAIEPGCEAAAVRVVRIFEAAPFVANLGAHIVRVGEGSVETTMPISEAVAQQDGFVHAGAMATLADHTAGAAAGAAMPEDRVPLSIEFKINMLRPAVGEALRCQAKVIRAGKTIVVTEAEVYAQQGEQEKLVSKATVTLAVVDPAR
jgi:uncharacterized protein (TIGR00369 family)